MTNNTMPTDNIPRRFSAVNGLRFVPEAEAEILHRYNLHDRLVEALESYVKEDGGMMGTTSRAQAHNKRLSDAIAALSLAKEGRE